MVTEGNPPDDVTVEVTLIATRECDDEYVVNVTASDVTAEGEISTMPNLSMYMYMCILF